MAHPAMKKVKVLRRIGNPRDGVILAPGAIVELTEHWTDYHLRLGNVVEVSGKAARPSGKKGTK